MLKKLANKKSCNNSKNSSSASSPFEEIKQTAQKNFLKKLSEHALNLYQKKTDIKNFTKLVLSDPQDMSHNTLVKENIDEYDILFDLTNNEEFLKDLGITK